MPVRPAVVSSVAGAATSTVLFAAVSDGSVLVRSIYNDSTAVLYVKYGATASSTSFTAKLAAGDLYEFPHPLYDGLVHGIWASATGSARLTEVTV